MSAQYRIGEFADLGGVSAKTLRFYDEIGLLRPVASMLAPAIVIIFRSNWRSRPRFSH
jgi:hypothetical protein